MSVFWIMQCDGGAPMNERHSVLDRQYEYGTFRYNACCCECHNPSLIFAQSAIYFYVIGIIQGSSLINDDSLMLRRS